MNAFLEFEAHKFWPAVLMFGQIAGVVGVAWVFASLPRRRGAATRHAIWLAALNGVVLGVATLIVVDRAGWSMNLIPLPEPSAAHEVALEPQEGAAFAEAENSEARRWPAPLGRAADSRSRVEETAEEPRPRIGAPAMATARPRFTRPSWRSCATFAGWVWGVGVLVMLGWLAQGLAALEWLRWTSRPVKDAALESMLAGIAREMGMPSPPRLLISDRLRGPVAIGILRPTIVMPEGLMQTAGSDRIPDILIHETAHLARRDPMVGLVQRLVAALFWPHPLIHVLNRELSIAREEVCDNFVLRMGNRTRYARTLVDLADSMPKAPRFLVAAGLWPARANLADRLTGLLDERRDLMVSMNRWKLGGLAVVMLLAGAPFALMGPARGDSPVETASEPIVEAPSIQEPAAPVSSDPITEEEIAGVVVDPEGKPVAMAVVDAYSWFPGHETMTDGDGRFRLRAFTGPGFNPQEGAQVRVTKEGYAPWTTEGVKGGTANLKVSLDNTTYFEGTIRGPDGQTVADALLRASNPVLRDGVQIGNLWTETRTDADGKYRLYVEPDAFDIVVRVPGVGVARPGVKSIEAGQVVAQDIDLKEGIDFRATVLDSLTGEPVAGLRLYRWLRANDVDIEGRSGADGIVLIEDLPPGVLDFQVQVPGYARWWSEEAEKEWHRKMLGVEDEHRGPWQRNFDSLEFAIREGMGPVTIVAEKGTTVRGRVLDPEGEPVAGATVAPALTGTGNSLTGDTRFSVRTNEKGEFEVLLPASGDGIYNLVAHDGALFQWRNWANGVIAPFQTKPGETLEGIEISLTRPATVRGRVVDSAGKPLAGREVRASAVDTLENRYYDPTTTTDSEGRFELKFIRPGEQFIQVAPFWLQATYAPGGSSTMVNLEAGDVQEGIELVAQPQ